MPEKTLMPQKRTALIAAVLLILAVVFAAASLLVPPRAVTGSGEALIGGAFTMQDQRGVTVTEKSFAGKYVLVFFGYTYCPDVCPTTLQVMSQALDGLGAKASQIAPVFVSIDPARDDVATMQAYVAAIDPRLTGLTGTPAQLAAMAQAYHIFYAKVPNAKRPQDYLMDHSSLIYLMGPDGKYLRHFNYNISSKDLVEALKSSLP